MAWKAAQSDQVQTVYVAPGNAGTALENGIENVAIAAEDIDGLLDFARSNAIGLTIVGPEAPLVAGVVDRFQASGRLRGLASAPDLQDLEAEARRARSEDEWLPWAHISCGVTPRYLWREYERATQAQITRDCREGCRHPGTNLCYKGPPSFGCRDISFVVIDGIVVFPRQGTRTIRRGKNTCF